MVGEELLSAMRGAIALRHSITTWAVGHHLNILLIARTMIKVTRKRIAAGLQNKNKEITKAIMFFISTMEKLERFELGVAN